MSLFPFFNEYPYRDTESLNLDWLLKNYKKIVDDVAALNNWKIETVEDLTALHIQVNNIENEIDTFEDEINRRFAQLDSAIHSDFDSLATEIRNEMAQTQTNLEHEFATALDLFTERYNNLVNQVTTDITDMKREIQELTYALNVAIGDFRGEMVAYIDERFDLFLQNLPDYEHLLVFNPFRGEQTTIQEAINDIYSYSAFWGITARQFDDLGLTCEEFEAFELTCTEFDRDAYKLLGYPDPDTHMIDPFSGEINLIKNVVMELYELHSMGLTAGEFDALDLTAQEFDNKEVTAFQFDFFGAEAA